MADVAGKDQNSITDGRGGLATLWGRLRRSRNQVDNQGIRIERLQDGTIWGLNPNRKYLIGIDHRYFSLEDAALLADKLHKLGIVNMVAMFSGDPNEAMKIIKARTGLSQQDTRSTTRAKSGVGKNATTKPNHKGD